MDTPVQYAWCPPRATIATISESCLASDAIRATQVFPVTEGAWPAANRALYIPFVTPIPLTIKKITWFNGSVVSGNIDVGILDASGARLVNSGSVAMAGGTVLQTFDIADTTLNPGYYYMAMAVDNATATFFRTNVSNLLLQACGMQQQAAAFTLPANATFANPASSYLPDLVLQTNTVI